MSIGSAGCLAGMSSFSFDSSMSPGSVDGETGSDLRMFSIENGHVDLDAGEGHSDLILLTSVVLERSSCS